MELHSLNKFPSALAVPKPQAHSKIKQKKLTQMPMRRACKQADSPTCSTGMRTRQAMPVARIGAHTWPPNVLLCVPNSTRCVRLIPAMAANPAPPTLSASRQSGHNTHAFHLQPPLAIVKPPVRPTQKTAAQLRTPEPEDMPQCSAV
jgi:hypothetical protein